MLRVVIFLLIPLILSADDHWLECRSGPFTVITDAGERAGRETLGQLEQLRWAMGAVLSKQDPKTLWPVRVLVLKKWDKPSALTLARDAYIGGMPAAAQAPRQLLRDCARILIEANAGRMPAEIESGLADFYSTEEVSGSMIVAGRPLPAPERNPSWAIVHLLSVKPEYYGKMRVLVYNLQQGADPEPAYRNAFGRSKQELEKEAAAWLAAGNLPTTEISGRPLNPRRDFTVRAAEAPDLAMADLLQQPSAYQAILQKDPKNAAPLEGLGLIAARAKQVDEARKYLQAAIDAGSTNAHAYVEYARIAPDPAKVRAALQKAAQLNANWAEPHFLLAQQETDPARKLHELRTAANTEPRNAAYWQAVAEFTMAHNMFPDAAKAWAAAERASVDDTERARIRETRRSIEGKRLEWEAAERKRREQEKEAELAKVKAAALAEVRAAEAKANRNAPPPPQTVVPWFEGASASGKVSGALRQIDCLRGVVRLVVEGADKKITRLVIRDPKQVVVLGGGQLDLTCGAQRRPRNIVIEYFPKPDAKLATAGEVATIEYK